MIIQGRLLIDPASPPELGWLEIAAPGPGRPGVPGAPGVPGVIEAVRFGELPSDYGPPDAGGRDRLITPAFTDAHMHVPQIDSVGADGLELLEWLDRVIFPAEAWWGKGGAVPAARATARRLLTEGTAGFAGFLTSHAGPSREALAWIAGRTPLRFIAGRSAMDRHAPDDLTAEDRDRPGAKPTPGPMLAPIETDPGRTNPRHVVSANPRFAVSCTPELLAELGWAARERGAWVHTHLAETKPECALVAELFPDAPHYTGVYDQAGLLGEKTLLAHGIYLSDEQWRLIAERRSWVVHCPQANVFLKSGLFDLGRALEFTDRVLLGSDIAAGSDAAMPRVARSMIETAKTLALTRSGSAAARVKIPTPAEAWGLITVGNGRIFSSPTAGTGAGGRVGVLEEGAWADVLVLRLPETWYDEHLVGRMLYGWSPALIESRVIDGVAVDPARI